MQEQRLTGVTFINAVIEGRLSTLRMCGPRITALDDSPQSGDQIIDLEGDCLLPGLINAHDHLQLNSLPPLESGSRYQNVREWIAAINARRQSDPQFEARVGVPRETRLAVGGIKNLLSGVTTVAHHDPLYPSLSDPDFPVTVVADYGWSHSLYIDGEIAVREAYQRTPSSSPWIIHAAEGVDAEAAGEWRRLEDLGCIGPNTVVVHGVALDEAARTALRRAGAGLVWCPTSNLRLFGRTADVATLVQSGRVALGTDSRLSGSRDLLEELRRVRELGELDDASTQALVTTAAARVLRLPDRGALSVGLRADLLVLPHHMPLTRATRGDVRLVVRNGQPRFGDVDLARALAPQLRWRSIRLDNRSKLLEPGIATLLERLDASEDGLEIAGPTWRAA